jgi:hypothetical protein
MSKGGSKGYEDELWEEAFAKMDEKEPLFQNLPETEEDARKVFEKCDDKSHVGPIVLVKGVPLGAFGDWLRRSELGRDSQMVMSTSHRHVRRTTAFYASFSEIPGDSQYLITVMTAISNLDLVHTAVKIQTCFGSALVSAQNIPECFLKLEFRSRFRTFAAGHTRCALPNIRGKISPMLSSSSGTQYAACTWRFGSALPPKLGRTLQPLETTNALHRSWV